MKPRFLIRQHRRIERLLHEVRADGGRREALRLRLVEDMSIHLSAELDVMYPALLESAGIAAEAEVDLLQRSRSLLAAVADSAADAASLRSALDALEAVFSQHVEAQETRLFPTFSAQVDAATLRQILAEVDVTSFRLAANARLSALRSEQAAP